MATWKHSLLTSFTRETKGRCEVRIKGNKIVVSYEQPDGLASYVGEEFAPGHFKLKCARKLGRAMLHRVPDENILEGYWTEGEDRGMWRIRLGEPVSRSAAPVIGRAKKPTRKTVRAVAGA